MRWVRVSLWLVVGGLTAAGATAPMLLAAGSRSGFDDAAVVLVVLTYTLVALVIVLARPGHPVGRLMLAGAAAWGVGEGLLAVGIWGLVAAPGSSSFALLGVLGSGARGLGWLLLVVVIPLVFPDGRAPSGWSVRLVTLCISAFTVAALLSPVPLEERLTAAGNPIGLPRSWAPVTDVLALGALALAFVCLVAAVRSLVRRYRHGNEMLRQQLIVFGAAFALPLLVLPLVATPWADPWVISLATLPLPVAVGVALLQRRLYDVQFAVSRTVAYVSLSFVLAGVYAFVVGGVGATFRDRSTPWLPWAAAGVVAVAFAPLRDWLQRAANRVTYGRWSVPAEVLADTGRRLADASDGRALLQSLTDEFVEGLGLLHAEIRDHAGHVLARAGAQQEAVESLDLTAYGARVGSLRWAGRTLRDSDRKLLVDLGHQMGGVVHAAGLVDELRATQERLVLAREQERRRLRRDLHDGLGPSLAGLGYQVDTVQNLIASAQPVGDRLDRLRTGLRGTVAEVRRIVEGLRPPVIDELGLFGAVAELGRDLAAGSGLELTLDLPPERPTLPAAVEVAAYRVTQEALTNVVRHANATTCRVSATLMPDTLVLKVSDDGCGLNDATPGIGTVSMRERAAEIGGHMEVQALPRGTALTVRLPLRPGGAT